ncbi:hypothetical protein BJF83_21395 [Nocardiopsis sp. CNR-923]|uniref:hypothetical protein n=1 Tax=Nocardiopsis sp. CNR-923 TaxID=1904965 RepID=UPI00095CE812|nr:hypothetical protein [Nocardiopsis sp. CNR-923]OLT26358.1 hypothetical protein BJF83_21395 [Nocardiopsis sp. CNR-923]
MVREAGCHPDTVAVLGARPWVPRSDTAPLGGLWAPVRVHSPDTVGPLPALVDVLESTIHAIDPLFTPQGAALHLRAVRRWNARVPAPCRLRLGVSVDDGPERDLDDLTGDEVASAERLVVVSPQAGDCWGPLPCGLYQLPVPPVAEPWRLVAQR